MSHATLMVVKPNGDVRYDEEFYNSALGASVIWDEMWIRWVDPAEDHRYRFMHSAEEANRLWALETDSNVPVEWRVALQFTFDYVLCAKHRFGDLVAAFRAVAPQVNNGHSHWAGYADYIENTLAGDPECFGVGLHATSVSCDLWKSPDRGYAATYNIFGDSKHRWIWDEKPVGMVERDASEFAIFSPVYREYETEDGLSRMTFSSFTDGKIIGVRETTGAQPLDQMQTFSMTVDEAIGWMKQHGVDEETWPRFLQEAQWAHD